MIGFSFLNIQVWVNPFLVADEVYFIKKNYDYIYTISSRLQSIFLGDFWALACNPRSSNMLSKHYEYIYDIIHVFIYCFIYSFSLFYCLNIYCNYNYIFFAWIDSCSTFWDGERS